MMWAERILLAFSWLSTELMRVRRPKAKRCCISSRRAVTRCWDFVPNKCSKRRASKGSAGPTFHQRRSSAPRTRLPPPLPRASLTGPRARRRGQRAGVPQQARALLGPVYAAAGVEYHRCARTRLARRCAPCAPEMLPHGSANRATKSAGGVLRRRGRWGAPSCGTRASPSRCRRCRSRRASCAPSGTSTSSTNPPPAPSPPRPA